MLPVVGNHESDLVKRINESQAGTESFDDWTLDKTMNRMYGPGIMYEVVIHLALHLGVKEIKTIGCLFCNSFLCPKFKKFIVAMKSII